MTSFPEEKPITFFGVAELANFIRLLLVVSFLVCIGISHELWFPVDNLYPSVPVFSLLEDVPVSINLLISGILVALLVISLLIKKIQRQILFAFCVLLFLSVFFDYNRIQPWVYYYLIMFLAIVFYRKKNEDKAFIVIQIIMAFVYIWSGLQKFNYTFFHETFHWINEPFIQTMSISEETSLIIPAVIAACVELTGGILLFSRRFRKTGVFILVGMHLYILTMLGPVGRNTNTVIWPWNISFILLLILLFYNHREFSFKMLLPDRKDVFRSVVIFLFGIMPLLSLFNLWPKYLSSSLYSGNTAGSLIYLSDNLAHQLPSKASDITNELDNSIYLNSWSQRELGVAAYPDTEVQLEVFKKLCLRFPDEAPMLVITIRSAPDIFTGQRVERTWFCDELNN